jgi:hypothetical protein
MNPFRKSQEFFRMKRVVALKNGSVYIGFVERMEYNQRHIVLKGAEKDGDHVGVSFLSHVEELYLEDEEFRVERVNLSEVEKFKYSVRSFSVEENIDYIEEVVDHGSVKSFPTVLELDDGYGVVDGHKRIWVCREAGLSSQPCRVVDLSNWEAVKHFAWNHFPTEKYIEEDNCEREERYSDEDTVKSIKMIYRDFGDKILDIYPVKYNVERLGISLEGDEE